jgi:outer membrane biosynthesis protein TonB
MLQKTQCTMVATALAVGACLAATARPAQAQVRIHMARGTVKTTMGAGIVTPPSSPTPKPAAGIVIPSTTVTPTPSVTPPKPPAPTPTVAPKTTPAPTPSPVVTTPHPVVTSPVKTVAAPQGFSPGPGLMGEPRVTLGRMVDRIGPSIIGDNGPTVQKVMAHR